MTDIYDIAVLGGNPSGYAAAYYLRQKGCEVILLDAPAESAECSLADWVPHGFFQLAGMPRSLKRSCKATDFKHVRYYNSALDKQVDSRSSEAAGHFIQAGELVKALRRAASKAGVKLCSCRSTAEIELREDSIRLGCQRKYKARLLLIAHGRPEEAAAHMALPTLPVSYANLYCAALDIPLGQRKALGRLINSLHIVESKQQGDLGLFFVAGTTLHLRTTTNSAAPGAQAESLSRLVSNLCDAGILPDDLPLGRAVGAAWRPPAGAALDIETHVAKRCVLIGSAGGFAESVTGQTIFPTVSSALLGADVALSALNSSDPQSKLANFKTSWRKSLAGYLQMPNTSLHMMLPLLFVNDQMVGRFTRTLLYGEDI